MVKYFMGTGSVFYFHGIEEMNMLKVYCYSRCTTCQKALKWLESKGVEYKVIDIKEENPDEKTLRKYYKMSGLPLKRFFNTSGMQYRELELAKKLPDMSEDEQFALLATDGMLVKRPLLVGKDFVLTGFKETEWSEKLSV
jgi:arsenate reductase